MMIRTVSLKVVFICLIAGAIFYYPAASAQCSPTQFRCVNGNCLPRSFFCDDINDCTDNSDERYCDVKNVYRGEGSTVCPFGWTLCPNGGRCINSDWICDGFIDCPSLSEEGHCGTDTSITTMTSSMTMRPSTTIGLQTTDKVLAKADVRSWFLRKRKPGSRTNRWGSEVHRIAVALHLADNSTFQPGNIVGEEIRYELTIQLLHHLAKDQKISSQELALYIHGLLVACMDPRDFYGEDLVMELRRRVEASKNYTNPFLILALCNAGDTMTARDLERVTDAYNSQHRPFWTDSQALASMAMSCISSLSNVAVDERILKDMLQELKRHQFRNGTVDNFRTTALVTQALFIHDFYMKDFDLDLAIKVLVDGFKQSKSLLNAYYVLPVLHQKSLLNVSSSHCSTQSIEEEEALQKKLDVDGETIDVQYSVWFGDEINLARTWRLKMRVNSTIYDTLETVAKIDKRQKIEYNVVDGKPYVAELNGKEDDPERGIYWFVYIKTLNSEEDPKIVKESPVDIKLNTNQEVILWYKYGEWSGQNLLHLLTSS